MGQTFIDISMSLDGFVAGPNQSLEEPLGGGGEQLHEWAFAALAWRESHGLEGGEANVDSDIVNETRSRAGASIMGRRMYSGGHGPGRWEDDPRASGWWGEDPPFHHPVFVLTHHAREPLMMQGGTTFTFVTDGIEAALDQARAAAGDRDVQIAGGGQTAAEYLRAGLVDEVQIHLVPILLGDGARLFSDHVDGAPAGLECTRIVQSPTGVAHLRYRVPR
jgi:dihydrofolate reductase